MSIGTTSPVSVDRGTQCNHISDDHGDAPPIDGKRQVLHIGQALGMSRLISASFLRRWKCHLGKSGKTTPQERKWRRWTLKLACLL